MPSYVHVILILIQAMVELCITPNNAILITPNNAILSTRVTDSNLSSN
jgi:hypothetical protein